ncbi:MAG: alpha-L-glutamate ligase-like protein [Bacterioplanes sp.]|nr:alpha-L-glutamate ligase-like protein [Bacterioplanes sp.]
MSGFIWPWQLAEKGILGMNRRNVNYIGRYNPRHLFPTVDNKLKTKLLAQQAGIPTPELLATICHQHDVMNFASVLHQQSNGFVLKPANGSAGKGIVVITEQQDDVFLKASGSVVTLHDLQRHVSNTLSGLHSLGGRPDVALLEERIAVNDYLAQFAHEGLPDIRVIVCRGFPVMAMVRLPTRASDGKANLHQGAVGVGLDIATGIALNAVQFGKEITLHPDNGRCLASLRIPQWQSVLAVAARCHDLTGLGYLGVDLVLDDQKGPVLLELNARPGLAIQVANGVGLLHRLQRVDALSRHSLRMPVAERVACSQTWFAAYSSSPSKPELSVLVDAKSA